MTDLSGGFLTCFIFPLQLIVPEDSLHPTFTSLVNIPLHIPKCKWWPQAYHFLKHNSVMGTVYSPGLSILQRKRQAHILEYTECKGT